MVLDGGNKIQKFYSIHNSHISIEWCTFENYWIWYPLCNHLISYIYRPLNHIYNYQHVPGVKSTSLTLAKVAAYCHEFIFYNPVG